MTRLNHKTVKASPCIKCGNTDVNLYRYDSLNCSGITCDSCKREILLEGSELGDEELIEMWNRGNNLERKILKSTTNRNKSIGPLTDIKLSGLSDFIWLEYGPDIWLNFIIDVYEELIDLLRGRIAITKRELKKFTSSFVYGELLITLFDTYLGFDVDEKAISCEELIKSINSKILQTLSNFHVSCERFNAEKLRELLDLMLIIDERKISDQESFKPLYM